MSNSDMSVFSDSLREMFTREPIDTVLPKLQHFLEKFDHTCSLAKVGYPDNYGGSAFNEKTIQDCKYHEKAIEAYYVASGSIHIKRKKNADLNFAEHAEIFKEGDWVFIPEEHCLEVVNEDCSHFIAIAFKSQKSNKDNGGKKLGNLCPQLNCAYRSNCEKLQGDRDKSYEQLSGKPP
ncbi:MAG: cupin domain-containing protein [Magnetococcus sp. YQC-5]